MLLFTVNDLVSQVRDQLQEENTGTVSDSTILSALNRGNSYAWDIYARHYPDPLIVHSSVTLNSAKTGFQIPSDAFEQRIQKVDIVQSGLTYELERLSYRRTSQFRNSSAGARPVGYSLQGRFVEVLPSSNSSAFSYECYYVRRPDQLRLQQGRISQLTAVAGSDDSTIVVDAIGSSLSTTDSYLKYVNFVNSHTGEIRGSAEIKSLSGTKITFKQTPTRTSVLGRTISGDIPSDLEVDDYITDINGSCVVFLQQPTTNFLIQYAVSEIRRALGYDQGQDQNVLKTFENQIEHTWAGRESSSRVKRKNHIWRR